MNKQFILLCLLSLTTDAIAYITYQEIQDHKFKAEHSLIIMVPTFAIGTLLYMSDANDIGAFCTDGYHHEIFEYCREWIAPDGPCIASASNYIPPCIGIAPLMCLISGIGAGVNALWHRYKLNQLIKKSST